jgi:hypothetical protein
MRTEKYNCKAGGDDIASAFEYNSLDEKLGEIDVIVAEVCGENDGVDWYWILQMRDGSFANASGGCDYTGWDCQSSASFEGGFKTPEEAIENLKVSEYEKRKIKETLLKQISGEIPFAIYQEEN